jgi:hypothetical protein
MQIPTLFRWLTNGFMMLQDDPIFEALAFISLFAHRGQCYDFIIIFNQKVAKM